MKKSTKDLVISACVAAIYVALSLLLAPISFGPIQMRVAEALIILCFFNKKYILPLTLACFITNLMGNYALYDIILGTLATFLSALFMSKCKNIYIASLIPVLFNGLIIPIVFMLQTGVYAIEVYLLDALTVAIGEFVSVSIIGVLLFKLLSKNNWFKEIIE